MVKKGQAAMEFLMTYGWAILVVLVVIAALAYFGVLDPSNVLPDKCTFPVLLSCEDYLVNSNSVQLTLVNNGGKDMNIQRITVQSNALSAACENVLAGNGGIVVNGESKSFTITPCTPLSSGRKKDKYSVNVTYNLQGSNFSKLLQGEILTKREA